MRRMLLPEAKIKAKVKDNIFSVSMEELLTHGYRLPNNPHIKSVIIQPILQTAIDSGIHISDSNSLNTEITNVPVTITMFEPSEIYIRGLGINIEIDLSVTNIEDININAIDHFDVYIIKP